MSAVAPAVLGAVVHLAVLVGRATPLLDSDDEPIPYDLTADAYNAGELDEHGTSRAWETAPTDRAAELIAAGAGRRRLSRELDITEYEARQLLARSRPAEPVAINGFGGAS